MKSKSAIGLSQAINYDDALEAKWQASFQASLPELELLATEALEEHRKGKTKVLDPDAIVKMGSQA